MKRRVLIFTALALAGCTKKPVAPGEPSTHAAATEPAPVSSGSGDAVSPSTDTSADAAFAAASLAPKSGSTAHGTVRFSTEKDATGSGTVILVTTEVAGATPGKHGLHVHELGDCSAEDASSAGEHLNPARKPHGGPDGSAHHLGDLGNVTVESNGQGKATVRLVVPEDTRGDTPGILTGKAVVLHEKEDDLASQPSGNSGKRIACGVIEKLGSVTH